MCNGLIEEAAAAPERLKSARQTPKGPRRRELIMTKTQQMTVRVPDMCCPVELRPIEKALLAADPKIQAVPDYGSRTLKILLPEGVSADAAKRALEASGEAFSLVEAPAAAAACSRLRVPEMDCPVEAGQIERELKKLGLEGCVLDTEHREIRVPAAPGALETAEKAVANAGYESSRIEEAHAAAASADGCSILSVPEMDCPVEAGQIECELKKLGLEGCVLDTARREIRVPLAHGALEKAEAAVAAAGYESKRVEAAPAAPGAGRALLSVPEMDCPVEAGEIEREFKKAGITGEFSIARRTISVAAGDVAKAQAAVASAGYEAAVLEAAAAKAKPEESYEDRTPWGRYIFALAVAFASEAVELTHEYGAVAWPGMSADVLSLVLAVAAIALVGLRTFKTGIRSAMHGKLNMSALMAVAVTGGVLIAAWPEAAMVMVLFEISEAIERLSMNKARRSIRDLMSVAPETASVRTSNGSFETVPVKEVGPGALIRVAPGARVPLDGKIRTGRTSLDQSMVTGESMPAECGPGDPVWAGTVNLASTIDVVVTAAASQSLTARIIEAVENAQASKSQVQRFIDRFAEVYTPIVFLAALVTAIVPPFFLGDWLGWLYKGLCLLVIGCPCALVISTPVTIVSALATATRCGLLIKGGLFLEEARKIKNVGFDKTGTLTKGEPELEEISTFGGVGEQRALELAASLGAMNKHPLSAAIAAAAKARGLEPLEVTDFTALPGKGVQGRVSGGELKLVSAKAVREMGLSTTEVEAAFEKASTNGMSASALVDAFGVMAVFSMADEVKADTPMGLRQLEAEGITPWLFTGDNARAANAIAAKVGVKHVFAELLPEDKLAHIRDLQQQGLTAMVGDGINDAPALAQADIGIAMGVRGTDSAIEAADVAVMDDRISSVATLVRLSRMTHAVLIQNIVFAIGIKILFAVLALAGMATMWMAVFADTGTCLIVVANGMRMMRAKAKLERMAADVEAKCASESIDAASAVARKPAAAMPA